MFFTKNAFGIDISDRSVEIVQLKESGGNYVLKGLARATLDPGIINNGIILNGEKLAEIIGKLPGYATVGDIDSKGVVFTLPNSQVFSHIFRVPASLDEDNIKEVLQYEAEGIIPLKREDTYSDFIPLPHKQDDKEKKVFYASVKRSVVESYSDIFIKAGFKPYVCEMESLSLARILKIKYNSGAGALLVDIGARTTNVDILADGVVYYPVSLAIAGDAFSEAISSRLNISHERAAQVKQDIGIDKNTNMGNQVFEAIRLMLGGILDEVVRSIDFFKSRAGGKIKELYLAGGSSNMPGLKEYFTGYLSSRKDLFDIAVKFIDPWQNIDFSLLLEKENFEKALTISPILYANALGVSLRGVNKKALNEGINLLK